MYTVRNYLLALLIGVALWWTAVTAMGTLAAIQVPREFFAAFKTEPSLAAFLSHTLLVQVPAILLAGLVAWCFFRLISQASVGIALTLAMPWFLSLALFSWPTTADGGPSWIERLTFHLSWQALPGALCVPLGVALAYLAYLSSQRRQSRAMK